MPDIPVEQALYARPDGAPPRPRAASPGFLDAWRPDAERLLLAFGDRPPGTRCPHAVLAQPIGRHHVAVLQVRDTLGTGGFPDGLLFHILAFPRPAYGPLGGDPFALSRRFPMPDDDRTAELPTLACPAVAPPPTAVDDLREEFLRQGEALPHLLGAAQALVDGGRVAFERPGPDPDLLATLWRMLPIRTRAELWPASFAFAPALDLHALALPPAAGPVPHNYLTEDQAADYPEGRYELALQTAVESGDQHALDTLMARPSRRQVWHLGLIILAAILAMTAILNLLGPSAPPDPPAPAPNAVPPR